MKSTILDDGCFSQNGDARMRNESLISRLHVMLVFVLSFAPWIPSMFVRFRIERVKSELNYSHKRNEAVLDDLAAAINHRRHLKEKVALLEDQSTSLMESLKAKGDMVDPTNDMYRNAEGVEETYLLRIGQLEAEIQDWSKRRMKTKKPYEGNEGEHCFQFAFVNKKDGSIHAFRMAAFSYGNIPHSIAVFHELLESAVMVNASVTFDDDSECFKLVPSDTEHKSLLHSIRFSEMPHVSPPTNENITGKVDGRECIGRSNRSLSNQHFLLQCG